MTVKKYTQDSATKGSEGNAQDMLDQQISNAMGIR
jgi:hypothetical protein